MQELDARKQTILRAIVVEYVDAAEPVGSELVVRKYGLDVKSATVRNEMAEMLEMGFLEQPHASAGRIPSDRGYRYYVDRLIVAEDLLPADRNRMRDAANGGEALTHLLRDTVRALSRVTQLLGVAATLREAGVTIRTAVVSALGPTQALFVLVLGNGHVENRMIECPPGLTLDELGRVNELLSQTVVGRTLRSLSRTKVPPPTGEEPIDYLVSTLWSHVRVVAREHTRGSVITEGEGFMFAQPEFRGDASSLADLLHELTTGDVLYEAVAPSHQPQVVTIGRENRDARLHSFSVVRQSFWIGDNETGVIAVVGPTRMRYPRSIPLVNYTAQALSDSLTRLLT